jgi:diacylglycerol kinase (ATP)
MTKFSLAARARSFVYAFAGLRDLICHQHNAWFHAAATVAVIATGLQLGIARADWLWLTVAILWVWFAEAMNTALEHVCDAVTTAPNENIRKAKDIAAGAVLISAFAAVAIGVAVFAPHLWK